MRKAIVLLSGGLDSCVAAAMAREDGIELVAALNVFYGQRHAREIKSFLEVAKYFRMDPIQLDISPIAQMIGHATALIGTDEELAQDRPMSSMTAKVPRTYVPGRNTIFLAVAQSIAEARDLDNIVVGFNAVDFSGYPDCRPIFVNAWNELARYATTQSYIQNRPIEVVAPIIQMSKASVVHHGLRLKAPLEKTWSCYAGGEKACGRCDSCRIRWNGFAVNGQGIDPIKYEVVPDTVSL
jgi:7-cyano-7-deazaguanine synthase